MRIREKEGLKKLKRKSIFAWIKVVFLFYTECIIIKYYLLSHCVDQSFINSISKADVYD